MQWSTEPEAGFTKSDRPVLPVIKEGAYGYDHVNVAQQRRDPQSLLNWTERIIRMRKEVPEIGWGDFRILPTKDPAVLAIRYDWRNNGVLCVHNLDGKPREIELRPGEDGGWLINLLSGDHSEGDGKGRHRILLEAYGYRWYRIGGLDYIISRASV
jgi:maltose alpha-D-glucosyltransferase/alpha-amylase